MCLPQWGLRLRGAQRILNAKPPGRMAEEVRAGQCRPRYINFQQSCGENEDLSHPQGLLALG